MLEPLLIFIAIILFLTGVIGSVLPVLPGAPLSWLGLLLLKFVSKFALHLSWSVIIGVGLFTLLVFVLENLLPIWSTKLMGASRLVVWGAALGFIAGFWFGPFGIIFAPFLGALLASLVSGVHIKSALKHASGAFIGLFLGIVLKFINLGVIGYWFVKVLF